ncbi:uncharacterized protein LOC106171212 [Lingula anatina]|uniref:Uncharacterized protein LOC106171212 n=1 Tax=Lingula anatina TaxID=7574 RepID=A0A1S3J994_LINAN|nr:uncharacterized protein LOC106171212 [Lingula anatina]|eukprot:XP_013406883.1 uncharacterized protein LOC106171212 [Lingula anatina]
MATGGADEFGGISHVSEETRGSNAQDSGSSRGPVSQAKREELFQRPALSSCPNHVMTENSYEKDELIHQLTLTKKSLEEEIEQLKCGMRVHEAREHRENDLEQALGAERERNRELQMEMEAQVRDYNLDTRVRADNRLLHEENQRLREQVIALSSQITEKKSDC